MGFIPIIGATLGAAAGGSASIVNSQKKQVQAIKNAQNDAIASNAKAVAELEKSQAVASTQAVESVKRRRNTMAQTIYTNPLGLSGQANLARKTLLGE